MPSKLVTCPESAHLEMIEFDDTPVGTLITACTRFAPSCGVACPTTCAARFDLRARVFRAVRALDVGDSTRLSTARVG